MQYSTFPFNNVMKIMFNLLICLIVSAIALKQQLLRQCRCMKLEGEKENQSIATRINWTTPLARATPAGQPGTPGRSFKHQTKVGVLFFILFFFLYPLKTNADK